AACAERSWKTPSPRSCPTAEQVPVSQRRGEPQQRRARTAFTPEQVGKLEKTFKRQKYVGAAERRKLAAALQLSEIQVSVRPQSPRQRQPGWGGCVQRRPAHRSMFSIPNLHISSTLHPFLPTSPIFSTYMGPCFPPTPTPSVTFPPPPTHPLSTSRSPVPTASLQICILAPLPTPSALLVGLSFQSPGRE
uniref:Homeobox domain-containing protein n=1 Tax=Chrysemys picta bellii TaxID=8478 RepID=A0A8C3F7S9_CHRPI